MSEKESGNSAVKRGRLICFEGCDRSGKSTQAKLLSTHLSASLKSFPNRSTPIGTLINDYLKGKSIEDHSIHLLFSANRWEAQAEIKKELNSGRDVILDRYYFSGYVYSVCKGLDKHWCRSTDIGLIEPDLIFYIQIDPRVASTRGGFGGEVFETKDFQTLVSNAFDDVFRDCEIVYIDASLCIEAIHAIITTKVHQLKDTSLKFVV